MLYSYKGQEPTSLPFRVRLDDGSTRTSLNELSPEELEVLGFVGPIVKPEFNGDTQRIEWVDGEYQVVQLTDDELNENKLKKLQEKKDNINYFQFWNSLVRTEVYKKLRILSSQSLEANTICTELISLFNDAKIGQADQSSIQTCLNILFMNFQFNEEEVEEVWSIMTQNNLDAYYTIPDEEFLSTHTYNPNTCEILGPKPFNSWILANGKWEAPIPYPTDGKSYDWNEDNLNWVEHNIV